MSTNKGTRRTCEKGHTFVKKSDCPACPKCEAERKPTEGFMSLLSAPVRRALETEGITTLPKLAEYTEKEVLKLHGIGPSSMPILRKSLEEEGMSFKA